MGGWTNPARPGDSGWVSTKPTVIAITGGVPVQFKNGFPNFEPWSQGKFNFPNLTGHNSIDFPLAYEKIAQKERLSNNSAAQRWLKQQGLTLHHNPNGVSLDLIPSNLHNTAKGIPHAGGGTILRNWDYSRGTPWQEFRANQIAAGARYVGRGMTVIGAGVDAASLYGEYSSSRQTGNYSNTDNEAARIATSWAGARAIGTFGAQIGAEAGLAFGPVGMVVGGIAGGLIGGAAGYYAGSWITGAILGAPR
jgi:hypothetical protein